jgi:hypothetical protein
MPRRSVFADHEYQYVRAILSRTPSRYVWAT